MKRHLILLCTSFLIALLLLGGLAWSFPSQAHASSLCASGFTELSEAPVRDVLGNHLGTVVLCDELNGTQRTIEGVVQGDQVDTEISATLLEVDVDPSVTLAEDTEVNAFGATLLVNLPPPLPTLNFIGSIVVKINVGTGSLLLNPGGAA